LTGFLGAQRRLLTALREICRIQVQHWHTG